MTRPCAHPPPHPPRSARLPQLSGDGPSLALPPRTLHLPTHALPPYTRPASPYDPPPHATFFKIEAGLTMTVKYDAAALVLADKAFTKTPVTFVMECLSGCGNGEGAACAGLDFGTNRTGGDVGCGCPTRPQTFSTDKVFHEGGSATYVATCASTPAPPLTLPSVALSLFPVAVAHGWVGGTRASVPPPRVEK